MDARAIDVALAAHRGQAEPRTLLVDEDLAEVFARERGVARLAQVGLAPEEVWALPGAGRLGLVILSAQRSAREMFRVLSLIERLVAPEGKISLLPVTDSASEEVRPEATEVFLGVYPEWSRGQVEGNVVELWRTRRDAPKVSVRDAGSVEEARRAAEAIQFGGVEVKDVFVEEMKNSFKEDNLGSSITFPTSDRVFDEAVLGKPLEDALRESLPKEGECFSGPILGSVFGRASLSSLDQMSGKRIVSLSIFGDCRFGTDFWKEMPAFVVNYILAHHALFSGYDLCIHHDEHLYHANGGDVLFGLVRRGFIRLVHVPSREGQGKCERMLHRLLPAWDPEVEVVVCRDVDSLPTWRDRRAVEEFVVSGFDAHTVLDSCSHMGMMGGLSAFRAASLRALYSTFESFVAGAGKTDAEWDVHGADQDWLNFVSQGPARARWNVLEHCLPKENESRWGHLLANQTMWRAGRHVAVRRRIADLTAESFGVSAEVAAGSDALVNHMGSAGYDVKRARAFYDQYSPVAVAAREAEVFAGGSRDA